MSIKIDKIASQLEKEISLILFNEVKELRNEMITITDVKVTNDLSIAKIFFTCLNEAAKEDIARRLVHAKGFIRTEIAKRVDMRHIPDLVFTYDDSIAYGNKIEKIIAELHKKDSKETV